MIDEDFDPDEPVEIPITGDLDLHTFRPSEMSEIVPEYLLECQKRGILRVRIAHGKGTGTLREGVHRLLDRLEIVERYHLADQTSGGWGATWVHLNA